MFVSLLITLMYEFYEYHANFNIGFFIASNLPDSNYCKFYSSKND